MAAKKKSKVTKVDSEAVKEHVKILEEVVHMLNPNADDFVAAIEALKEIKTN